MKKGSVTVFFSLIFTVVLALICTVIESARTYVASVRAYGISCMALESEFAGYSKEVFGDYGVLLLWPDKLTEGMEHYINMNNGKTLADNFDILNVNLKSIHKKNITYVTDDGGDEYVKQSLKYVKFQAVGDATGQILKYLDLYNSNKINMKLWNEDVGIDTDNNDNKEISIAIDKEAFKNIYFTPINDTEIQQLNSISDITLSEKIEGDKENISVYNEAKSLLQTGILEIVLPEDIEVSQNCISEENLPSKFIEESRENLLGNVANKAMFVYYLSDKFTNFVNKKDDNVMSYQLEYILQGKLSDKENLLRTVTDIAAIRQIFNTIYVLSDNEKMTKYTTLASSISTGLGVPFIQSFVKAILIEADAMKETVDDIRALLKGDKIKLLKSHNQSMDVELSYENYLQILIMLHKNEEAIYRSMDLIQTDVNKKYNSDFRMSECIMSAEINVEYQISSVFTSLPLVSKVLNDDYVSENLMLNVNYSYVE